MITLTGNNQYLIDEYINNEKKYFLEKYGDMSLEKIDCENAEPSSVFEAIQNLPFLVSEKLVLLYGVSKNKLLAEKFVELDLKSIPDTVKIIIVESNLDKRTVLYKFLKSNTEILDQSPLDNIQLAKWLVEQAKNVGSKLSMGDANFLVSRVGTNQLMLKNELEKIITNTKDINRDIIEQLTDQSPQSTIFDLIEAAISGRVSEAINLYREQRIQKVEPQQVIAMLLWQLRIIAIIKSAGDRTTGQISKDAKLNPFVVTKSQKLAKYISYKDVKYYLSELLKVDIKTKSQSVDVDDVVIGYIMLLSSNDKD